MLSVEELIEVSRTAASLGITKVRLTGGEPLVRRGIEDIVRGVARVDGIRELCMTTNGELLARELRPGVTYARMLKEAGVSRVNISLDALDPDIYREVTRGGDLGAALRGIDAAFAEGLTPVKVNAVLMGGVNDSQIEPLAQLTADRDIRVRFIELMPIGECADWNRSRFIGGSDALKRLPSLIPVGQDGVAEVFRLPGAVGTVGVIHPVSRHFCPACDRIRVTADGRLKPCLHSQDEIMLKGLAGERLAEAMRRGIWSKPMGHGLADGGYSESLRGMSRIGG
jgi:cyclic pyranopterin phosphate synthase